jgi:hypothetical protein
MSESSATAIVDSSRNQRLAIFAVVGAVVVAVAVYLLLFSGGSSAKTGAVASTPHPVSVVASSSAPVAAQAIPAAYSGDPGRNPFQPAETPPAPKVTASAAPSGSAKASASPSPTVIVIPTLSFAPTPTPTSTPTPTVSTSPSPTVTVTATPSSTALPTASGAITLTLTRVDSTGTINASVTSGGTTTPYTNVAPGTVFGTYFKLVSIVSSDPAAPPVTYGADFEYGDQFIQLAQGQSAALS